LAAFFARGHAADLALLALAVEFIVLTRLRGRARLLDRALALLPGACLLLALRAALTGAPWPWVAAFLAASFPFHLADLTRRRL
jgi:hypothetical protein